jgi:hypothetical protein
MYKKMKQIDSLSLRKVLMLLGTGAILTVSAINVKLALADYGKNSSSLLTLEALADGEAGGSEGNGNPYPVERLKLFACRCVGSVTYGATSRCSTRGTGEKCTSTQQGSNACYEGTTSSIGTTMLCEGRDNYRTYD